MKQISIYETHNYVTELASEYSCNLYYVDFEMENNYNKKRNHCVITINFDDTNPNGLIQFLKIIKNDKTYHIETIYHDETNNYVYASKNYLVQNTNKSFTEDYLLRNKTRIYSDREKDMLNAIGKL